MRKAIPILIVSVAIAGWHFYVCMSMENECYNINPLTDVATLKMPGAERLVPGAERLAFTGAETCTYTTQLWFCLQPSANSESSKFGAVSITMLGSTWICMP